MSDKIGSVERDNLLAAIEFGKVLAERDLLPIKVAAVAEAIPVLAKLGGEEQEMLQALRVPVGGEVDRAIGPQIGDAARAVADQLRHGTSAADQLGDIIRSVIDTGGLENKNASVSKEAAEPELTPGQKRRRKWSGRLGALGLSIPGALMGLSLGMGGKRDINPKDILLPTALGGLGGAAAGYGLGRAGDYMQRMNEQAVAERIAKAQKSASLSRSVIDTGGLGKESAGRGLGPGGGQGPGAKYGPGAGMGLGPRPGGGARRPPLTKEQLEELRKCQEARFGDGGKTKSASLSAFAAYAESSLRPEDREKFLKVADAVNARSVAAVDATLARVRRG